MKENLFSFEGNLLVRTNRQSLTPFRAAGLCTVVNTFEVSKSALPQLHTSLTHCDGSSDYPELTTTLTIVHDNLAYWDGTGDGQGGTRCIRATHASMAKVCQDAVIAQASKVAFQCARKDECQLSRRYLHTSTEQLYFCEVYYWVSVSLVCTALTDSNYVAYANKRGQYASIQRERCGRK